jgi:hypothetical protein
MTSCRNRAQRTAASLGGGLLLACALACGSLEPGEQTLTPILRLPDPARFARVVHPALTDSCARAACHGRPEASLRLRAAEPLPPQVEPAHPLELPEPYRGDYYTVLAFCDLAFPEASALFGWGTNATGVHPGSAALTPEAREPILAWLRGAGATP